MLADVQDFLAQITTHNSPPFTIPRHEREPKSWPSTYEELDLLWEEAEDLYERTAISPQLCELRNMITVGYLIVKGAAFRKESRGLHFNTNYPEKSELVQNIVL